MDITTSAPAEKPAKPHERMLVCLGMEGLTQTERIVLAVIAYHDGNGGAWPKAQTIGDLARISRSRAFAVLKELGRKGRVVRKQWRGANRYRIAYCAPFPRTDTVPDSVTVSEPSIPSRIPTRYRPGIRDTN